MSQLPSNWEDWGGLVDPDGKLGPEPEQVTKPPTEPSKSWTLGQFYAGYARDTLGITRGTLTDQDYCQSLKYWQQFTGDPPISKITPGTFAAFLNRLKGLTGLDGPLSNSTRHKHWGNIQRLLSRTGPRTPQIPDAAELVEKPVYVKAPKKSQKRRPAYSLEDIWALLEAAWSMPQTPMIPQIAASVWWRSLIIFLYNTGQRIGAAMGARIERLNGRWLFLDPQILKGESGLSIWLNDPALDAVRSVAPPSGPIFGWRGWPKSKNTLHKQRRLLEQTADVEQLGFYGLRRAFAQQCGAINRLAAKIMMGHKGDDQVMIDHYLHDAEPILSAALTRLAEEYQPRPPKPPKPDLQKVLFDKNPPEIP